MKIAVTHIFYDVYMGWAHASLKTLMLENVKRDLRKGEVALFLNKKWTGCKVLAPNDALIYLRTSSPMSAEMIRFLPTAFGGSSLGFSGNLEANLLKNFETKFGKQMKRLKVNYA